MQLTNSMIVVATSSRDSRAFELAAGALASVLLLGCSAEPDDALNDNGTSQTSASALRTSGPTSASPQVPHTTPPQGPKAGSAEVVVVFNHAPQVINILSDVGRLNAGDHAQLRAIARDPDGDKLTYAWKTECNGNFDHPLSPTPDFTLDTVPATGSCDLVVTVSDGHGGEGRGILTISTAPPPPVVVADPPQAS
jgi:hypothetical protein